PIWNDHGANLPVALHDSHHGHFIFTASSSNPPSAFVGMHIPGFTADESLIDFDFSRELYKRTGLHCPTNAMHQMPSGLLSDSEMACHLITTDSVFASHEQAHGEHPLVHAQRTVLKNASDFDGELLLAPLAEPDATGRNERMLFRSAARALDTFRPAEHSGEL